MSETERAATVLVVDDTPENIAVLQGILSDNYLVKAATSGRKALSICEGDSPPDLVLLDVMMPEMDGYEVCSRLKASERTRDIPIIFVTAVTDPEEEARGFEAGAVDYITKPISPPVVVQRVRSHLELRSARRRIEGLSRQYASYISPEVARSIKEGGITAAIGSSRKKLSVLFTDIQDFTRQTEKLEPEDMTFLLNHYFDVMTGLVHKHKGTLDKYIGDALLVFFGDPETMGVEEDARQCVSLALAMQEAIGSMQEAWRSKGIAMPLAVRMGVTTGFCTVGNFGSTSQHAYTIMGTPVNLASRLQSHARAGSVLVSEETYQLVKDDFSCSAIEPIQVKGISYPVPVYEVAATSPGSAISMRSEHCSIRVDREGLSEDERARIRELLGSI